MELIEAIRKRKSIRGYKPSPVPKEILKQILEIAVRAPSGVNCQPWEFVVLGGGVMAELKRSLEEQFLSGVPMNADFPTVQLSGVYRKRQVEVGVSLYQLAGIAREDKEKRKQWTAKVLRGFDAPNMILVCIDQELSTNFQMGVSLGCLMQTAALAALNFGLGTCLMTAVTEYPQVARRICGVPDSKKLVDGIAIGYPDPEFPPNKLETSREPVDNITKWLGF